MHGRLKCFVNKHNILSEAHTITYKKSTQGIEENEMTKTTSQTFTGSIQEVMEKCLQAVGTFLHLTTYTIF